MAELQFQLALLDARQASRRAVRWVVVAIVAGVLLLSCLPVALIGLSYLLVALTEIPVAAAFLTTGAVFGLAAICALYVAWKRIRGSMTVFARSRDELLCNMAWFKRLLKRHES
jgi:hypothetical protein